jgi:four helix bundle protein
MAEFELRNRAFQFSVTVLKFFGTIKLNTEFQLLKIQLYRSITSIGANITEGSSGSSKKQLSQYLSIALRSANESFYWLKLIDAVFPEIEKNKLAEIISECEAIVRILGKSVSTLKSKSPIVN